MFKLGYLVQGDVIEINTINDSVDCKIIDSKTQVIIEQGLTKEKLLTFLIETDGNYVATVDDICLGGFPKVFLRRNIPYT